MSQKFKVGDRVRCIKSQFGNETVGKIYVVRHDPRPGVHLSLRIVADDKGNPNSYDPKCFELVQPADTRTVAGGGSLTLEVGRRYRTRGGLVSGPVQGYRNGYMHAADIWMASLDVLRHYPDGSGRYDNSGPCEFDLLELLPEPGESLEGVPEMATKKTELEQLVETANAGFRAITALYQRFEDKVDVVMNSGSTYNIGGYSYSEFKEVRIRPAPAFAPFKTSEGYEVKPGTKPGTISIGCQVDLPSSEVQHKFQRALNGDNGWPQVNSLSYSPTRNGLKTSKGSLTWDDVEKIVEAAGKVAK